MTTTLTIRQVMSPCPVAVNPHHTFAEAHGIMRAHGIRHLPVEEAMTRDLYKVGPDEPLIDVVGQMLARRIGSALVVENQAAVGIFTCVDALEVLRHLLEGGNPWVARSLAGGGEMTGYHGGRGGLDQLKTGYRG